MPLFSNKYYIGYFKINLIPKFLKYFSPMSVQESEANLEKTTCCPVEKEEINKTDDLTLNSKIESEKILDAKENEAVSKKKLSPFLSSGAAKEVVTTEEENSSTKRQHDQIDKISKDRSIFNATGKLYFKSTKTGKMETRGEGKFLILKDDANMYKLMMIRDLVMLKGCNHYISPSCPLTKATQVKNSWIWTALFDQSDAEKNEDSTLYFATFRDQETFNLFEEKYKEAQAENLKTIEAKKSIKKENK